MDTEDNKDIRKVLDLINQGKNIFVTGKAGSGKTTLLRDIQGRFDGECITVAPTGVAAINAGGVTIHSLFSLSIGILPPDDYRFELRLSESKKAVIRKAKKLVIDEISMVRADLMDAIDRRLRITRRCKKPFGGMQVILFGDLLQLPPVVKREEEEIFSQFYEGCFFFWARVFRETAFHVVELKKVYRQKDEGFISILNSVRGGSLSDEQGRILATCVGRKVSDNAIHLCARRETAARYNEEKLGEPTHVFEADIKGDFRERDAVCDMLLKLRAGARVMITKNDTENHLYHNGTLGTVDSITEKAVRVMTDDGYIVELGREIWESCRYELEPVLEEDVEEEGIALLGSMREMKISRIVTGTCSQIPLTLAYATTIHKSQGLTFDSVALHISQIFQTGQLYTALSRCRTLEGMSLDIPVNNSMLGISNEVRLFERAVEENGYLFIGMDGEEKKDTLF